MPTISVDLDPKYEIVVEPGLLARVNANSQRVAIITDSNVAPLHLKTLENSLKSPGRKIISKIIPAGEAHKNLQTVSDVYAALLHAKIERNSLIFALGGGVVGDLAGFVAATILRGVPFVQVPTTLLSMVDASVGGKTGIDHAAGKNLIGAFHQPIGVLIDPTVLNTLPQRELRSGLAECIKHEVIRDADGFAKLEKSIGKALELDAKYLTQLIAHNVAIKAAVVAADPLEKGERAHLNLGHTFGHAIEKVSDYALAHGECVAFGMVAASRLAKKLGMLDEKSVARITDLIAAAGLPTGGLSLDGGKIVDAMSFDKKVKTGRIRFVLPDRIGHVLIRDDVKPAMVRETVESLKG